MPTLAASRSQKWLREEQNVHPDHDSGHRDHGFFLSRKMQRVF
jgi:hypothetical protein